MDNERLKKIAKYTLAGTAIGAITGNNAGKGALIGATLGALTGGNIIEISPNDINLHKKSLILFYMPTCPACIRFKPVYDEVDTLLKKMDMKIPMYALNVTKYDTDLLKLPEPLQVVPTLLIVPGGEKLPYVYKQNMSANNIVNEVSTIEGGRRRSHRMYGGSESVEGGSKRSWKMMMYGGDLPVEGGRRRNRMRGGETVEGGEVSAEVKIEGGETQPAVEGGEVQQPAVEGGRRRNRMRGGETQPAVEGGEVQQPAVEGGEVQQPAVEGGRRRYRMRGGETQPAVEGGETQQPAVEGGEVSVEGGEIEIEGGARSKQIPPTKFARTSPRKKSPAKAKSVAPVGKAPKASDSPAKIVADVKKQVKKIAKVPAITYKDIDYNYEKRKTKNYSPVNVTYVQPSSVIRLERRINEDLKKLEEHDKKYKSGRRSRSLARKIIDRKDKQIHTLQRSLKRTLIECSKKGVKVVRSPKGEFRL